MTLIKRILIDSWMRSPFPSKATVRRCREKQWNDKHLSRHAANINDIFHGFDYIVEVDYQKTILPGRIYDEFRRQFCFPSRELGDHCQLIMLRGIHTNDERILERNEFGSDCIFVGTNNERDAIILQLKYRR